MALGKNVADREGDEKYKEKYNYIFSEEYFKDEELIDLSPNYILIINNYNHSYKVSDKFGYSISCQHLFLQNKFKNTLFSTKFVFGKLFYYYLLHQNENEYFICGNDMMDFTVYNITKELENRFFDICKLNEDSEEDCQNEFWYISRLFYNPKNNLLAISGQDGMNVSTVTICDLSNPDDLYSYNATNLGKYINDMYGDYCCSAWGWTDSGLHLSVCEENSKDIILNENEIISLLDITL